MTAGLFSQGRLSHTSEKKEQWERERNRTGEVFPETKSHLIELKNSRKINTSETDFLKKSGCGGGGRKLPMFGPRNAEVLFARVMGQKPVKGTQTVCPEFGGNRRKMGFGF